LVEIGLVVLEKKSFKGKVDDGRRKTVGRTTDLRHGISSAGLWPGELKIDLENIHNIWTRAGLVGPAQCQYNVTRWDIMFIVAWYLTELANQ